MPTSKGALWSHTVIVQGPSVWMHAHAQQKQILPWIIHQRSLLWLQTDRKWLCSCVLTLYAEDITLPLAFVSVFMLYLITDHNITQRDLCVRVCVTAENVSRLCAPDADRRDCTDRLVNSISMLKRSTSHSHRSPLRGGKVHAEVKLLLNISRIGFISERKHRFWGQKWEDN